MNYQNILKWMLFLPLYAASSIAANAQAKDSAVKAMVESRRYVFHARTA